MHADFADDLAGEELEGVDLIGGEGAGDAVHEAECAEGVAALVDERGAGVEADEGFAGDEGVIGEAGVLEGVGDDEGGAGGDGVVAEGEGTGGLFDVDAVAGLEPSWRWSSMEGDGGDGDVADAGGELDDARRRRIFGGMCP